MGDSKPEVLLSGSFWFNTAPDSSVAGFFEKHDILEDSLHPYVLGKITLLPTRLLDLNSLPTGKDFNRIKGDPRSLLSNTSLTLVETTPGSKGQYIALSYCWGQHLPYTTTTTSLPTHQTEGGIKYAHMPKALQDAVFLVRYLGKRYLWVDCLCIVQDDASDWEQEASRMAEVYSNAYLTLSATRARHCGESFLQARKTKDRHIVSFVDCSKTGFDLYFYYDDLTMSQSLQNPT
ncbi:HET-domain-containing protein [Decorospora gaudefroyi]|uniref:HET-domain-containing protein n=1 Tax=Decorospora gaudefroyi TaxID=184978 RepID=A0A6A5K7I4_9PLEO|nr:HET-domain-containing protein [Decorospora gaudefroyi]